jgi:hypothetical protein
MLNFIMLSLIKLNVVMLIVVMLIVVMLYVVMLSVLVPLQLSLMFARKVAYTKEVPFTRYTLRYAPDLTRPNWIGLPGTNTLAYYKSS